MTIGIDDQQSPQAPALTRRELRERERAAEVIQPIPGPLSQAAIEAAGQPSGQALERTDGIQDLFGAPAGGSTFVPPAPSESAAPFVFPPTPPAMRRPAPNRASANTAIATRKSTSVAPKRLTRTAGSRLLSLGALIFAGALAFGMSVPANAFYSPSSAIAAEDTAAAPKALQSVEVASNVEAGTTTRDEFSVLSWAEVLKQRYGTRDWTYTVGMGSVRWPFPAPVPISSGFGDRVAPCRGCSSHHMGVDFTPGNGSAIFVIADGVVIEHSDDLGGFGNHVIIEHHINGHTITTLYAHMQHGSVGLNVGDAVRVGDFIGLVGMTGTATGPHLHLEVSVDGVKVDPFAWLKANAN